MFLVYENDIGMISDKVAFFRICKTKNYFAKRLQRDLKCAKLYFANENRNDSLKIKGEVVNKWQKHMNVSSATNPIHMSYFELTY